MKRKTNHLISGKSLRHRSLSFVRQQTFSRMSPPSTSSPSSSSPPSTSPSTSPPSLSPSQPESLPNQNLFPVFTSSHFWFFCGHSKRFPSWFLIHNCSTPLLFWPSFTIRSLSDLDSISQSCSLESHLPASESPTLLGDSCSNSVKNVFFYSRLF